MGDTCLSNSNSSFSSCINWNLMKCRFSFIQMKTQGSMVSRPLIPKTNIDCNGKHVKNGTNQCNM